MQQISAYAVGNPPDGAILRVITAKCRGKKPSLEAVEKSRGDSGSVRRGSNPLPPALSPLQREGFFYLSTEKTHVHPALKYPIPEMVSFPWIIMIVCEILLK